MAIIHKIEIEWYQYLKYKIRNERSKSVGMLRVYYDHDKTLDKIFDFDGHFY